MPQNGISHFMEVSSETSFPLGFIQRKYFEYFMFISNGPEACHYLCEHSDCEVAVVENREQLKKYLKIWD